MALVLGPSHVAAAPAQFTIAKPLGLVLTSSGIPNFIPRDPWTPTEYHHIGRINLGNSLGMQQHVSIVLSPQLVYPLADELTLVNVSMQPGMTVTIDEIVRPAVPNSSLDPWDRGATAWSEFLSLNVPGPTSPAVVAWTYTVPAGKILMVDIARLRNTRTAVATGLAANQCFIAIGGQDMLNNVLAGNTVGDLREQLLTNPVTLLAGETISATYRNSDTGGSLAMELVAHGLLFNA
jgi:hypothetical protein